MNVMQSDERLDHYRKPAPPVIQEDPEEIYQAKEEVRKHRRATRLYLVAGLFFLLPIRLFITGSLGPIDFEAIAGAACFLKMLDYNAERKASIRKLEELEVAQLKRLKAS